MFYRNGTKYNAKKVEMDGITFDSKKEAKRYQELKILERAGLITNLRLQVEYILLPSQREPDTIGVRGGIKKGKVIEKECKYIADFVYNDKDGNEIVEDAKGMKTKEYRIKKKMMLYFHKIKIQEV